MLGRPSCAQSARGSFVKCLESGALSTSGSTDAALTAALQLTTRAAAAGETATRAVLGCADS